MQLTSPRQGSLLIILLFFALSSMILIPAQSAFNFLPNSIFMEFTYASESNDEEEDITITDTFEPPPDDNSGHDNAGDSNSGSGDDNSGNQKSAQHEATEVGTVYVKVNNPYGNGLKPGDFTLKIRIEGSGSASPKSFEGDFHGTDIKFSGNAFYSLKDTWTDLGYTIDYGNDCPDPGEMYPPTFTCHITFDQNKPPKSQDDGSQTTGKKTETKTEAPTSPSTLNVVSIVKNDNGGKFLERNFTISINGSANPTPQTFVGDANGTSVTFSQEGSYQVNQSIAPRYNITYSPDCSGSISAGQIKTCTITADDKLMTLFGAPSYITVISSVINDNGGTKGISDFTVNLNGNNGSILVPVKSTASPGIVVPMDEGIYKVVGVLDSGYDTTYSTDCSGNIARGESKLCTINYNDR